MKKIFLVLLVCSNLFAGASISPPASGGSGSSSWGGITGTLSDQTDLQSALDGKSATTGNASIATVGTITTGTWNATAIALAKLDLTGLVESYSGHIETAEDKIYVVDHYASYAKKIVNIRIKCTSGTATAALKIGGTNITTCNGISVSSSSATTTCDTGSSSSLAANGELTLVISSNSSCTDLVWTIKTTRN